ncbi:gluconokinase [Kordiimonas sp.]|uniref:gluconokinase n=1 Tax=Kordiimonas sp. TaxID=1970157 RepID=UPI003A92B682
MTFSIIVMGVSGCGKSTLGRLIAEGLSLPFVEGDDLHPPANIQKMAEGQALNDDDRVEFLRNIGEALASHATSGVVVSCSALKRQYRDTLRSYCHAVSFVLADVSREVLMARLAARKGHFMPASLLESQLAILERPDEDERAFFVDGLLPPVEQAARILDQIRTT